ncbi:MAG TPA: radical SAM protein [Candidatus Kapabacteria bacterium]|jgi:7-carboxy-7-deazaguanine synthase
MPEFDTLATQKALSIAEKQRPDVLRVNEIFYSIQGEGTRAGEPCIFIRMTGCGLRCTYCDTEYAFYEGEDKTVDNVLSVISSYDCKLVELTGGEPLEQEGVYMLIDKLLNTGYEVMIETGGHVDISRVDRRVKRIVDFKTPSSGMMKRNRYENIAELTSHDEVKFVIGTREDYDWAKKQIPLLFKEGAGGGRPGAILFSPVAGTLALDDLAAWILEDHLPVRLQTQLHKLIWPDVLRGV